jgi:transketolase
MLLFRDGRDVLIVSTGLMTMRALEATEMLRVDRLDIGVLHVPTIKPLDSATILAEAGRGGRMLVVAENHTVIGRLGEAVAGLLMRSGVAPKFRQIGLPDEFLDAGRCPLCTNATGFPLRPCLGR